jgi:hypothetical protein
MTKSRLWFGFRLHLARQRHQRQQDIAHICIPAQSLYIRTTPRVVRYRHAIVYIVRVVCDHSKSVPATGNEEHVEIVILNALCIRPNISYRYCRIFIHPDYSLLPLVPFPVLSSHIFRNNFHRIEKRIPCNPFANILVFKPRPKSPSLPSCRMTCFAASVYEILVSFTCRYVFTTLKEFEMVSDATDAQNPINAARSNHQPICCLDGSVMVSERKLYTANHG